MKNLYIPKGKTLHYETLYCQNIVNDGTLIVDGTLHARSISCLLYTSPLHPCRSVSAIPGESALPGASPGPARGQSPGSARRC